MDPRRFDHITASLAGTEHRRRLLVLLTVLPVWAWLRPRVGIDATVAAHPVERIQKRRDHHRKRARRRQDRRHDQQTQDNGEQTQDNDQGDDQDSSQRCVPLDQPCGPGVASPCCAPTSCQPTFIPLSYTCHYPQLGTSCASDDECQVVFGPNVECVQGDGAFPFLGRSCRPKACSDASMCADGGKCCAIFYPDPGREAICCPPGRRCGGGVGGCAAG